MSGRVAVAAGLAALLSSCGSEHVGTASDPPPIVDTRPVALVGGGPVEVSCGSPNGWAPEMMEAGEPGVLADDEAAAIFERIVSNPELAEEARLSLFAGGVDVEWRVLHHDDDSITLGLGRWSEQGPLGPDSYVLEIVRDGDAWRPSGWEGCQLAPVLADGHSWVEVTAYRASASDSTITALVTERECASGRDPASFLHDPEVVEDRDSVTIYWTSQEPAGAESCPANPTIGQEVALEEPLGGRVVLDGSRYPPREVEEVEAP